MLVTIFPTTVSENCWNGGLVNFVGMSQSVKFLTCSLGCRSSCFRCGSYVWHTVSLVFPRIKADDVISHFSVFVQRGGRRHFLCHAMSGRGPGRPRKKPTKLNDYDIGAGDEEEGGDDEVADSKADSKEDAKAILAALQAGAGMSPSAPSASALSVSSAPSVSGSGGSEPAAPMDDDKLITRVQSMLPRLFQDLSSQEIASAPPGSKSGRGRPKADNKSKSGLVSRLGARVQAQSKSHYPHKLVFGADAHQEDEEAEEADGEDDQSSCAAVLLARGAKVGSVALWCNQVSWKNSRNRREAQALAEAFDAFVDEGLDVSSIGLELLSRRLIGVQLADKANDWSLCDAIQGPSLTDSALPRSMFSKVLKDAAAIRRLTDRTSGRGSRGRYGSSMARQPNRQHYAAMDNWRPRGRGAPRQ